MRSSAPALQPAGLGSNANRFLITSIATLPAWLVVFTSQRLYNIRFIARRIDEARRIVNASFLGVLLVALAGLLTGSLVSRSALAALLAVSIVLVFDRA